MLPSSTNYAGELRANWKPLLAATLGLATGMSLQGYVNSIFAPLLVEEFGWTRVSFALTAMVSSVAVLCIPIAGRLTDQFGVKPVAIVGLIVFPLSFLGMSLMTGSIYEYVAYNVLQLFPVPLAGKIAQNPRNPRCCGGLFSSPRRIFGKNR